MSRYKNETITVGVTGLNAHDNPGAGMGVIRALRDVHGNNIKIIGLAYETLEPGIYMEELVDRVYQIPFPAAGADALENRLLEIDQAEGIDLVIPNFDAELENFIRISKKLAAKGIHSFLPGMDQLQKRDKIKLADFGVENGFDVPKSTAVSDIKQLKKALEDFDLPVMIKGRLYEAYYVNSKEEAEKTFHRVLAKWGAPVIIQQYVSGTEINVAGLSDDNQTLVSAVAMRKQYITDKGKAWAGITISDDSLIKLAEQFVKTCKWKGAFELELLRGDNKTYLLEVNPRFPAWIYLASAAGQNQPDCLVKMALGEKVEPMNSYNAGKMFVRYSWDNVVDVSKFQQFSMFGQIFYN